MSGAHPQPNPRCPRCGYDQSGLIATWTESCPLAAICTECGYSFDPGDAIHPTRKRLPWLYEHAKHWWSVRAWWRTVLMLLWPPLFWKRVRPEHEVRPARIALMMLVPWALVAIGILLLNLADHLAAGRIRYSWKAPLSWPDSIRQGWASFSSELFDPSTLDWFLEMAAFGPWPVLLGIFWLPASLAFLAISSEWAGTRLTRRHFGRLTMYAAVPLLLPSLVASIWEQSLGWYRIVYLLQPPGARIAWPDPWSIDAPNLRAPAILALTLIWLPLYWLCAIRYGYALPSTKRPFLVVLSVLLTPWALFLAFQGYYAFIA